MNTRWRFFRFNLVGAIGIAVQLLVLALLRWAGMHYLVATVLAVEAAILHNFVWHEHFTWCDRVSGGARQRISRVARFHLTNGAVSLVGNVVLMRWLAGAMHLPVIPANLIAITACWLLNFVLSDRVVFTRCAE